MTIQKKPKDSTAKQSLTPQGAIWLAAILGIICAWDSGIPGYLPTLDRGLLIMQAASVVLLIVVAIIRDIQLKTDSVLTAIVAWSLFVELGIFLQADQRYAQAQQCERLREHGKLAGAKILQSHDVFTPRGSDHRPQLTYVKWQVSLPDGSKVTADAIEPQLNYACMENRADTVMYLPDDPTCVRAAATIKHVSEFSMFDQVRAFSMLLLIPSAFNALLVFWFLRMKKPHEPTAAEVEEQRAKLEARQSKWNEVLRRPKTFKSRPLVLCLVAASMIMFFIIAPLLSTNRSAHSVTEPSNRTPVQQTETGATSPEEEVFPSPNVPRLVAPFLKKDWGPMVRWEKEKNGGSTVYKGYDAHELCHCQFDFEQDAGGNPTLKQEYFINYQGDSILADGIMLVIKIYRYVPQHPGDIFDPDQVYPFEKDETDYTYKVTPVKDWANYYFNKPGSAKYLMYVMRAHEHGNGSGDDPMTISFERDKSYRLTGCQLNSKPLDLRASEQMLKDKFMFWSEYGVYE